MTAHKHLKQLIRSRMEKTGERYTAARRHIIGEAAAEPLTAAAQSHLPGNVAAATVLRILLKHAGVRAPHTGKPFSEAMAFGIAGGIGIGVFSFYYEKEDFASFFIGGRHQWHDDLGYLNGALGAFGIRPAVQETSGKKTAAKQLAEAVAGDGICVAWVDMASLPHRGMPDFFKGMTYHVITVYDVDKANDTALIGDLTDYPVTISLEDLEAARTRIVKQKFRLLSIDPADRPVADMRALVAGGLRRCVDGLLHPTLPQSQNNARLEALKTWAARLDGSKDPLSWERIFKPGLKLWRGLNWVCDFVEYYGTGGGLCRPLFAEFLDEAAAAAKWPALKELAARYHTLGRQWSELAEAALPVSVPLFRRAGEARSQLAELRHSGAPAEETRAHWGQIEALAAEAKADFPLSGDGCADLRKDLQARVLSLYEGEAAALKEMTRIID